jgi:hypothetical protein
MYVQDLEDALEKPLQEEEQVTLDRFVTGLLKEFSEGKHFSWDEISQRVPNVFLPAPGCSTMYISVDCSLLQLQFTLTHLFVYC